MELKSLGYTPDDFKDTEDVKRFILLKKMIKLKSFEENLMEDLAKFYNVRFDIKSSNYLHDLIMLVVERNVKDNFYIRSFDTNRKEFPLDFFYERLMVTQKNLKMEVALDLNSDLDYVFSEIFKGQKYISEQTLANIINNNKDVKTFIDQLND